MCLQLKFADCTHLLYCPRFYFTFHNFTLLPQFYFTVHNSTLQSTILLYIPHSFLTPDMFLWPTVLHCNSQTQFLFRVQAFTIHSNTLPCDLYFPLQPTIWLWTAQGFFKLHNFTVESTIFFQANFFSTALDYHNIEGAFISWLQDHIQGIVRFFKMLLNSMRPLAMN